MITIYKIVITALKSIFKEAKKNIYEKTKKVTECRSYVLMEFVATFPQGEASRPAVFQGERLDFHRVSEV